MTEHEAYVIAFGRNQPELDGAGRDCFAELMREVRRRERPAAGRERR